MQEEGENIKRGTGTNRDTDLPLRNWPCELVVVPVGGIPSTDRLKSLLEAVTTPQSAFNVWSPLNRTTGCS